MTPTAPAELRALIARGRLTQAEAARIVGSSPRTMRRWLAGDCSIPLEAYMRLQTKVEQEELIAEALAEGLAWEASADDAPPPDSEEARAARLSLLRDVAREQYARVCRIEDELMEAQAEHRATQRRLNRMLAEELKGDIRDD